MLFLMETYSIYGLENKTPPPPFFFFGSTVKLALANIITTSNVKTKKKLKIFDPKSVCFFVVD